MSGIFVQKRTAGQLSAAFLLGTLAGPVQAENWTVTKLSGEAWVRTSEAPQAPITLGMSIPVSASIGTSATGRVMLERGQGRIFVSPSTSLIVQDMAQGRTQVLQSRGKIEIEVEKRGAPYFSVETPLLSALVKGTRFTTSIAGKRSDVHVDHGIVEVKELATGKTVDLTMGQSASTASGGGHSLSVSGVGQLPEVRQEAPKAAQVGAATPKSTAAAPPVSVNSVPAAATQAANAPAGSAATENNATRGTQSNEMSASASASKVTADNPAPPSAPATSNAAGATGSATADNTNSRTAVGETVASPAKTSSSGSVDAGKIDTKSGHTSADPHSHQPNFHHSFGWGFGFGNIAATINQTNAATSASVTSGTGKHSPASQGTSNTGSANSTTGGTPSASNSGQNTGNSNAGGFGGGLHGHSPNSHGNANSQGGGRGQSGSNSTGFNQTTRP